MKKTVLATPRTGVCNGLAQWKRGSRGPPKPLKMYIFSTFLMIFHQNGLRYRDLRDFGVKKGSILTFFARFWKKPWGPPWETRKMGHFSGDFQYEIAITFQKSIEKGVRLGVFGVWGPFWAVNTQIYHIYLALAMLWFGLFWLAAKWSKSLLNTYKKSVILMPFLSCQYPDISH